MRNKAFVYLLIGLFVYLYILVEFFHPISAFTQDLGRHLLLGKMILQTYSVPKTNLLSYTYPNFPFINTHWLSEVVFYLITQAFGLGGLLFVMASVAAISVSILIFTQPHPNPLLKGEGPSRFTLYALPLILYSGILLERTDLRPEIFSFFFMSIFMWILWRYRNNEFSMFNSQSSIKSSNTKYQTQTNQKKICGLVTIPYTLYPIRWLFALPLIEILWVNMHIYFPIGILLIGLFLIEDVWIVIIDFFKRKAESVKGKVHSPSSPFTLHPVPLLLVLTLTCLTTLLNPNFLTGALYPFTVFKNYGYTIEENQSIFFLLNYGIHNWSYLFFGICALGLFVLLLINAKRTRPIDWLLAIVFTYIASSAIRNLPLFVFGTFPTAIYLLTHVIPDQLTHVIPDQLTHVIPDQLTHVIPDKIGDPALRQTQGENMDSRLRGNDKKRISLPFTLYALPLIVSIFTFWMLYLFFSQNGFGFGITPGAQEGVDFFIQNHIQGPLFNNFDIGSYLDYRLYLNPPAGGRVFVDGRPEAYPASFFQNIYIPMQENPQIFKQVDKKYHFQSIFFSYTDQTPWAQQFLINIMQNPEWQLVYLDTFSAIWIKKDPQNQPIIQKYAILKDTYMPPVADSSSLMHLLYFFNLINWPQPEVAVAQKIVEANPTNCAALGILAQNPSTSLLYGQKYQANCR